MTHPCGNSPTTCGKELHAMTLLAIKKPVAERRRAIRIFLSPRHSAILASLQATYAEALGRPVSTTVVTRRAFRLLQDHLEEVAVKQPDEWAQRELGELMRAAG